MKSIIITAIALSFAVSVFGEDKAAQFKDQKDKFSYAVGLNIGINFKRQNIDVNTDMINAGVKDGMSGKPQMTMDQIRDVMMNFEKDMQAKQAEAGKKNEARRREIFGRQQKERGREDDRQRFAI